MRLGVSCPSRFCKMSHENVMNLRIHGDDFDEIDDSDDEEEEEEELNPQVVIDRLIALNSNSSPQVHTLHYTAILHLNNSTWLKF